MAGFEAAPLHPKVCCLSNNALALCGFVAGATKPQKIKLLPQRRDLPITTKAYRTALLFGAAISNFRDEQSP